MEAIDRKVQADELADSQVYTLSSDSSTGEDDPPPTSKRQLPRDDQVPPSKRQQAAEPPAAEPPADEPPPAEKIDMLMAQVARLRPTPSRKRLREALAAAGGDVQRASAVLLGRGSSAAAEDQLMAMGFSREQARAALDRHGGDAPRAVEALLSGGGTDDEALARKMQAAEYSGGGGPSGVGSSSADDDEEIARALERQLNGGGGGGGGKKLTPCRYGASCRHRRDGLCPYRHEEPSEAIARLNAAAKARYAREAPPPRRVFDCVAQPLHLNKLGEGGGNRRGRTLDEPAPPSEIGGEELLWWPPYLQHALFATYGVDYEFVRRLVAGSPATARPNGVVVVSGNEHTTERAGFDDLTHAPWTVVMPPFFDEAASSSVVQRMERGTMHPKLHLLEFDGGSPESRFLRVVIASANLGPYEHGLNNQFWVHDFPPAPPPSAGSSSATGTGSVPSPGAPPPTAFAADLLNFLCAMLRPAPTLSATWAARLKRYDLTPPPGVHLIASVPGRTPSGDGQYGLQALRRCLRAELERRPAEARHSLVEYAFSSVGSIDRLIWQKLCDAFRMGAAPTSPERVPLPRTGENPRAEETSKERARAFEASTADVPVHLIWPSMATMFGIMGKQRNKDGGMWWVGLEHGPVGPGGQWTKDSFPTDAFCHHVMPHVHRSRTVRSRMDK